MNASYSNNQDLSKFDSLAKKADVFAIGESAHGVGGYQNFHFRLSKYLISRHGYRFVVILLLLLFFIIFFISRFEFPHFPSFFLENDMKGVDNNIINCRRVLVELLSDDRALNQYVTTGEGDLRSILYHNPWQNSDVEMYNFYDWIRQYNALHPRDMVTVHTVDPQQPWLDIRIYYIFFLLFLSFFLYLFF